MCRTRATSLLPSAQKLARRRTSDRAETCLVALASPWSVDSADPVPPPVREFGWPRAAAAPCCLFKSVQPVRRFGNRVAVGRSEMVGAAGGEQRGFGEVVVRDDPHGVGAQLHGGCYRYPGVVASRLRWPREARSNSAPGEGLGQCAHLFVGLCWCWPGCSLHGVVLRRRGPGKPLHQQLRRHSRGWPPGHRSAALSTTSCRASSREVV